MSTRSDGHAETLLRGARDLATLVAGLSDAEWQTPIPHDGRTVGVVVHHVASVYPIEIQLALALAAGKPVTGVTWDVIAAMNAAHANDNKGCTKAEALEVLRVNSAEAAEAIRGLSDAQLDSAAPI
ncbi:MAG TPA: maleylpyruvate isomerase N-terminal domain-containing protein [Gemmatimonadales bacterium]|jgi:hypothetical protein